MDREQAKALWPIIKAYAEGKQIEIKPKVKGSYWDILEEDDMPYIDFKKCDLRIKPEPEYRPFKDAEECFEEMKKHQPFAWIKDKQQHEYFNMISICINAATTFQYDEVEYYDYQRLINEYTFADGTPFGVKVME